jgi:hypothetical protein
MHFRINKNWSLIIDKKNKIFSLCQFEGFGKNFAIVDKKIIIRL